MTCTLVAFRQLRHIQTMDLGLDGENVVILFNNPGLRLRFDAFRDELLKAPAVRAVTSAAQGPTWVGENIPIDWEGNPSGQRLSSDYKVVDYDFFETFGMAIVSGRAFSREFPADEAFNRQCASDRQTGALFSRFDGLSVILSCLGLSGLASYAAEQRTKEIGVRKVLGASVPGIVSLTTREFLKWVAVAHMIGWPAALLVMNLWLK